MLCPAVLADVPVADLGLGRGKIRSAHAGLDSCSALAAQLWASASYGSGAARALGLLDNVVTDKGHDVDVDRLKLPPPGLAATFPLGDYLVDPAVRAAYLDPRTLELPRAATPKWGSDPTLGSGPETLLHDEDGGPPPLLPDGGDNLPPPALCGVSRELDADGDRPGLARRDGPAHAPPEPGAASTFAPPGEPFQGRPCHRVPPAQLESFLEALDTAGMLGAVRDVGAAPCGFFTVLKEFDEKRGVWILRLILDRRPRNAGEAYVPMDPRTPHGSLLTEIVLPPGHELRAWCSDLPQFYYRMQVTPERMATNSFGDVVDGHKYRHLKAVQDLIAAEGLDADAPVGPLRFALGTMAMGDRNATSFAQAAHIELLRRAGAMCDDTVLSYRGLMPEGSVYEGAYIDDRAVFAEVPAGRHWASSPAARRAVGLFDAGRSACAEAGIPDVEEKLREGVRVATIWGCEMQGGRGRAGAPRARRTVRLAMLRACSAELLASVLGLWVDVLLYRRAGLAVLGAAYRFVLRYQEDGPRVVRALPGVVVTELLGLAALAPVLDTPMRAQVSPIVKVSDASPCGAAVVETRMPQHVVNELWRWRVRPGRCRTAVGQPGFRRGDSAVGELLEADRPRVRIEMRWSRTGHPGHIHVAEARSRRALWREASHRVDTFGQRHLCVYDSSVVAGVASRGRSSAVTKGISRELRLTYPYLLATDCVEGPLWEESEANLADWGSRGRSLPVPAPRRAWADAFVAGDVGAWRRRLSLFDGREPEPPNAGADVLPQDHDYAGAAAFYGSGGVRVGPGFWPLLGGGVDTADVDSRADAGALLGAGVPSHHAAAAPPCP